MAVPTYDKFIETSVAFSGHLDPEALWSEKCVKLQPKCLVDEQQRAEVITSGQLTYQNRTGWAHDRPQTRRVIAEPIPGKWCLTPAE